MKRLAPMPKRFEKGDCYYAAYATLEELSWDATKEEFKLTDWRLVHGIAEDAQGKYGHGWLEKGDVAFDPMRDVRGERWRYHMVNKISYFRVYTLEEAYRLVEETKTYGYWDPKIGETGHLPRPTEAGEVTGEGSG